MSYINPEEYVDLSNLDQIQNQVIPALKSRACVNLEPIQNRSSTSKLGSESGATPRGPLASANVILTNLLGVLRIQLWDTELDLAPSGSETLSEECSVATRLAIAATCVDDRPFQSAALSLASDLHFIRICWMDGAQPPRALLYRAFGALLEVSKQVHTAEFGEESAAAVSIIT